MEQKRLRHLLAISCLLAGLPAASLAPFGGASACTGSAQACPEAAREAARESIQRRLDRTLATTPDGHIQKRLQGNAWDPAANGEAPWSVTPGDDVTDFSTSISQWGSWAARNDAKKIEQAKPLLPDGVELPAPAPAAGHSIDVWAKTRRTTIKDGFGRQSGDALTSYVGTDYAPLDGVVFGGLVQFDRNDGAARTLHAGIDNEAYLAGPYAAVRLTPNITVDGKLAWGNGQDALQSGSVIDRYNTSRRLAKAQIKGEWDMAGWKFAPAASAQVVEENAVSQFRDAEATAGFRSVNVGPRVSRRIKVGNNKVVEPFMHLNSSLDLDTAGALLQGDSPEDGARPLNTIGGGLTLSQQDDYTLSATTDVEGVGGDSDTNLRSRLNLTIPLD